MRYLLLVVPLFACGLNAVPECPSRPGIGAPCCDSEVGQEPCLEGQRWVCETTRATPADPNDYHPTWFTQGCCSPDAGSAQVPCGG